MAGIPSYMLLLCTTLLMNLFLVVPVLAEEGTPEKCKSNEEHDSHGKCCSSDLMDENEEGKTCFEQPSEMTVAVAFSLIGSFSFFASLMFAINWPQNRMRRHAYKMISSTISIFCAVLMFQCINGLVEDLIVETYKLSNWSQFVLDFVHFIVWYTILQRGIALASGVTNPKQYRINILDEQRTQPKKIGREKERVIIRCESFGGVLAHLTGFASINVWASLQQKIPFNDSPLSALLPVGICILSQIALKWIMSKCRAYINMGDNNKDWFEIKWDECCDEAADDVMGLTLSVLFANAIRMAINGMNSIGEKCLPNEEQEEEGFECEEFVPKRNWEQVLWLFVAGYLLLFILFGVQWTHWRLVHAKRKEEEGDEEEEEEEGEGSLGEHSVHVFMISLAMAFAWCIFHAERQLFSVVNPSFLGDKANVSFTIVVVALVLTYLAWMSTWILDQIQELPDKYTPPSVDSSIKKVVDAIALLIGFAWEQVFDVSVGNLADSFRKDWGKHAPAVVKLILATICSAIAFLAWQWYFLPFVVKEGWRFKFVFTAEDLLEAATAVADKDPDVKRGVLPMLQRTYSQSPEYKLLPAEPIFNREPTCNAESKFNTQDRIDLLEKLNKIQAENTKLRRLLGENMQVMVGSLKALHTGGCSVAST
mmetsp:Transcript_101145/g.174464  ORF Transcript_101145/g.174464 Transcript_101145/m.174464 type:complete len:651 (+) Transcript_101145:51-2003(+)